MPHKEIFKNKLSQSKGFTLIEVILVVAMLVMILMAVYNLLFFGGLSYHNIKEQSLITLELNPVIYGLESEIKKARKANHDDHALSTTSTKELFVYSDTTGNGKPEKIRYRVINGHLKRSYAVSSDQQFPYSYDDNSFGEEVIVMKGIVNEHIFTDLVHVNPANEKDYRKKLKIHFVIETKKGTGGHMEIESYLMTRSRVEAD